MKARAKTLFIQSAIKFGGTFLLALLLTCAQQRVVRAVSIKVFRASKLLIGKGALKGGRADRAAKPHQGGSSTTCLRGARPQLPTETPRSVMVGASSPAHATQRGDSHVAGNRNGEPGLRHTFHFRGKDVLFTLVTPKHGPPGPSQLAAVQAVRDRSP